MGCQPGLNVVFCLVLAPFVLRVCALRQSARLNNTAVGLAKDGKVHVVATMAADHRCLHLSPDEAIMIYSVPHYFSSGSLLMARTDQTLGLEDEDDSAMRTLMEALLGGCAAQNGQPAWFIDAGVRETSLVALAASLGCAVAAFDPQNTKELEATRCVNEPNASFEIFHGLASNRDANFSLPKASNGISQPVQEIRLDNVFPAAGDMRSGKIALLRLASHRCCGVGSTFRGLEGARGLLESRRVHCAAMDFPLDASAPKMLQILVELEGMGYQLLHAGPVSMPQTRPKVPGPYTVYRTDAAQLTEFYKKFLRIRRYDVRMGSRAYSDGLSLSRDGHYFDYTDFLMACQQPLPPQLTVKGVASLRFQDGRWWPEVKEGSNATPGTHGR